MVEPEWDEHTRNLALALDHVDLCQVCGRPASLCQDPARQDDWQVGQPVRCHATTALRQTQRTFTEETNPVVEALMWPVILRDESEG
jgi:hypothetical protein